MDALLAYLRAVPRGVIVHPMTLAKLAALMGAEYPAAVRDVWFWERSELAQRLRGIGFVGILSEDDESLVFVRSGGAE